MSPPIPEHYSSLVPAARRGELETSKRRTVSAASEISLASSTSEFVDRKIDDVTANLQYVELLRRFLTEAFHDGQLAESRYNEAMNDCLENIRPREQELVVLKRQKKIILEDLAEEAPQYTKMEDAYASIITNKVMGASGRLQRKKRFNQGKFRTNVMEYYGASKRNEEGDKQEYCHLTGWILEGHVKAAHIVPISLYSDEVSYLFGVGDAVLSDPSNGKFSSRMWTKMLQSLIVHIITTGITLRTQIGVGLDSGLIVLVPMAPKPGEETKWKCVLTDKTRRNNEAMPGWKWKVSSTRIDWSSTLLNRSRTLMARSCNFWAPSDQRAASCISGSL